MIDRPASYRIAQLGLGIVPEGRQVSPNLTVRANLVAIASNRHRHTEPWTVDQIFDLLLVLAERRSSIGHRISGGEQQMLAIGLVLMTNPKLLI